MSKNQGFYTYIMSNELGLVKVGQSSNPENRRKQIEAASGLSVTLEAYEEGWYLEELTQAKLNKYNKKGEWFECSIELAIEALKESKKDYMITTAKNLKKMQAIINSIDIDEFPFHHGLFNKKEIEQLRDICRRTSVKDLVLDEVNLLHKFMLYKLVEFVGGVKNLSEILDVSTSTIYSWIKRGRISKTYAIKAANHKLLKNHFEASTLRTELAL